MGQVRQRRQVGDEVTGIVTKITDFGLFIELAKASRVWRTSPRFRAIRRSKLDRIFRPGDEVRARIIKIDWNEKKIGLTLKDVEQPPRDASRDVDSPADEAPSRDAGRRGSGT